MKFTGREINLISLSSIFTVTIIYLSDVYYSKKHYPMGKKNKS